MKDKFEKNQLKFLNKDWNNSDEDYMDEDYQTFENINKKGKKIKDDTRDIGRGRKLNKRTYR